MSRVFNTVVKRVEELYDIRCDICGESLMGVYGYETGIISGSFDEGPRAGDRLLVELCGDCFEDVIEFVLLDKLGTCMYTNTADTTHTTDIEGLRSFYAARRRGLDVSGSEHSDDCEEHIEGDEEENK